MLTVDSENNQIVDYGQYQSLKQSYMQVNKKHIKLNKKTPAYQMHTNLVDTEISVCSKELMKHLSDDIEIKQLKEEFIVNLNTSELTDDKV